MLLRVITRLWYVYNILHLPSQLLLFLSSSQLLICSKLLDFFVFFPFRPYRKLCRMFHFYSQRVPYDGISRSSYDNDRGKA